MATTNRTAADVIQMARENKVDMVDLKFTDVPGTLQHLSLPMSELTLDLFEEGTGFDGSSIRGFQTIDESDMLLVPDPNTAAIDPVYEISTISLVCNVRDPIEGGNYSRDPRWIAQKAEQHLISSGIGDISYWGPELEFFIFDSARFGQNAQSGYYFVDSDEGVWNSGAEFSLEGELNKAYRPRHKEGYFPAPPMDTLTDIRSEAVLKMQGFGIEVEKHHHEVATAGQGEIDMRFDTLATMADKLLIYKYVIKNVARRHGKTATFMPKPIFMDNGSGMHTHQSIWKKGKNLMFQSGTYGDLSQIALYYIGGLLHHAPSLLAFTNPTTNSYRRLVPGYEAPINLIYSCRNRSACVRIPMYSHSEKSKRVEFRCPDVTCNPYLAFAAMLMAGIDGIQNKILPPEPVDKNLYDLPSEDKARVMQTPGSLDAVLDALEGDHEFLLKGDVFSEDMIQNWIDYKRENEVDAVRLRPHPYEFSLYYDI